MPKITAKTVASKAGVSVSAVSRAFRPDAPIAPEKRSHILKVARALGYVSPWRLAVTQMGIGTIAMVAADISNPFYPMALEHLSKQLHTRGQRLIFHAVPEGLILDDIMQQVLDFKVDGVILTSETMSSTLAAACRANSIPVVHLNRIQADFGMTAVSCDNYGGGRMVAQRFVEQGRKRIAFMGGRPDTSTHLERARGFRDALAERDLDVLTEASGMFLYQRAFDAAKTLMAHRPLPDALFCANDIMALAALDVAKSVGVSVPDDIAIIGFDDIPQASWQSYRLTTVRQPIRRMISAALDMIDNLAKDPADQSDIRILPGELQIRETG